MEGIYLKQKLRPCQIWKHGITKRALFHGWDFVSNIGVCPGGTEAYTRAIVELENGCIITVNPESIKFLDNKFDEYCWD